MSTLAIDGGPKVRNQPMPARGLLGEAEKAAAVALFDAAIASGNAFGYNGPSEQQYEKDFVEVMGGGYADAVNSGTNALFCALGALRLDALSEVICPPITDPGGVMPIVMVGCVPVVADADPRSYNTSAAEIEPLITERTRAIVVAHIAGDAVDMAPVMALAAKHDLYVVEDCAQAHGAFYHGQRLGTIGHIAAFSTMYGKHHCTGGQGGVVYTQDETLHWQGRQFADRGKPFGVAPDSGTVGNVVAGINCNLNDLSAAIGSAQLKKLPSIIANRVKVGNAVRDALAANPIIQVGWQVPESQSSYWFLRMHLELDAITVDKATFCTALGAEGIPVTVAYRAIPAEWTWFREKRCFGNSGFPWDCSDYHGPKEPVARIEQAVRAVDTHFNIALNESYGDQEIADIVAACEKVAAAYAK
jgi:dTDP-4-amino-4,6-dideoxygalactose transaminase